MPLFAKKLGFVCAIPRFKQLQNFPILKARIVAKICVKCRNLCEFFAIQIPYIFVWNCNEFLDEFLERFNIVMHDTKS